MTGACLPGGVGTHGWVVRFCQLLVLVSILELAPNSGSARMPQACNLHLVMQLLTCFYFHNRMGYNRKEIGSVFSSVLEEKILKLEPQCNNYNLMNYHKTSLCSTLSKDLDLRLTLYTSLFVFVHVFSSFLVCGNKTFCN